MDWNLAEDEVQRYRKDLDTIVQSFTEINSGHVYYVPGNVSVMEVYYNSNNKQYFLEKMKCDVGLMIDCDVAEKR